MRKAARAIIIKNDELLLMHRNKFGHEYDVLIGGGISMGESPIQALLREIKEEAGIEVSQPRLVFIEQAPEPYGVQYIFLCNYISGDARLDPEATETKINQLGQNLYQPIWRKYSDFINLPLRSESLKRAIISGIEQGFPEQPIDITNT